MTATPTPTQTPESTSNCPELLSVSVSPHIRGGRTTAKIMRDVLIALTPAALWGAWRLGLRALILIAVTVGSAILFEWLYELIAKRRCTVSDCSAAVTGLLLAMNLPVTFPFPMAVAGSFFAIVVVKQVFGGIGKNVFNPALAARVFLCLAWPAAISDFTRPTDGIAYVDSVSAATPLASLKAGTLPDVSVLDLFLGNNAGVIGEISSLLLILGGVYLLIRRVIAWQIPAAYLGTVALAALIFPRVEGISPLTSVGLEIFSGGLLLAAIFMATDYVTSPVTGTGRLIFGAGCGLLTVFIRRFGGYSEGASFAILIMNALVWYLDRVSVPKVFGTKTLKMWKKAGEKEKKP